MPDVVKIVFQLFDGILVAFAVGIIDLGPSGDSWLHEVPKVIKRDGVLVPFSALAPLGAWANQADVAFERVPELRQLIEPKFPQPPAHTGHSRIALARVNVCVRVLAAATHGAEFEKNETFSIASNSFLSEQHRSAVVERDEERNKNQERGTNHQRDCRGKDIEKAFKVVIGGGAR